MPDGTPVWARITGAGETAVPPGELSYTDVGFADRVEAHVEDLQSVITGVARSLAVPLRAVRPDEVSVEFGIELTAKAGKVIGLLADGEAKAGIKVTLTWGNGGPPDPAAPAAPAASAAAMPPGALGAAPGPGGGDDGGSSGASGSGEAASAAAPGGVADGTGGAAASGAHGAPPVSVRAGASPGASVHGGGSGPVSGGEV